MKAIVVREDRWAAIFDAWLREAKEAASGRPMDPGEVQGFLQYHAHDLKKRLENA